MAEAFYAEYESSHELLAAIEHLRGAGYRRLDAYTPYSSEELRRALGRPRSRLPVAIFFGGLAGAGLAYFLQWLLVAYLYPLDVGGRPPHMPLAFVVITFEMGVLAASFTAVIGVVVRARLLRLYDPVFEVAGIGSSSIDRHWLRVDAADPHFDRERSARELAKTQPSRVVLQEAS